MTPRTLPALLDEALRSDGARPAVTWVEIGSGTRVELSVATLANWVAKTGGLLQDDLDVQAGDEVRLDLGAHWQGVSWLLACWAVGAVVVPADATPGCTRGRCTDVVVEVLGEGFPARTTAPQVAVGLGPFGGPVRGRLRDGALDAGAQVLGHPDLLVAYAPPGPADPAVRTDDGDLTHSAAHEHGRDVAARLDLPAGGRLLSAQMVTSSPGIDHLLAVLAVGGALVLADGARSLPAPALGELVQRERVDVSVAHEAY